MSEVLRDIVERLDGLRIVLELFSNKIDHIIKFKISDESKAGKLREALTFIAKLDAILYTYSLFFEKILGEVL